MFDSYLRESILGRAIKEKKISISFVNPRLFVKGKYKKVWPDGNVSLQVDDRPYGGGPGMVMMAEPVIGAVENIIKKISKKKNVKILIINFIPNAEKFNTTEAKKISKKYTDIILICGRYEGIDYRVQKILKTENISIGDYVLTGGEIPAMVLVDSIARQVKGVLGNINSLEEKRKDEIENIFDANEEVYTRPEVLEWKDKNGKVKKYKVPAVMLSGDHKKIVEYKSKKSK
jgi:tRNA (guanine37-N1)-methyltransferase